MGGDFMENEFFIYTKDEWDLSLLYCAELFSTIPSINIAGLKK